MNAPERRTFWACAAGWALERHGLHDLSAGDRHHHQAVECGRRHRRVSRARRRCSPPPSAAGSPVSCCDRIGRVRTMQITIIWFSAFSLVCAVVQNFEQLLIARALLGFGFGGEWAAAPC